MGKRFLAVALAVLAVPVVMLAAATEALACSCADTPYAAQVASSDLVFTGEAVDRAAAASTGGVVSSSEPVRWTFRVQEVRKGVAGELQPVVSALSEASCGFEFELGATYTVLAHQEPDGSFSTGLCRGTAETAALATVPPPPAPATTSATTPWWQLGGLTALLGAALVTGVVLRRGRRSSG